MMCHRGQSSLGASHRRRRRLPMWDLPPIFRRQAKAAEDCPRSIYSIQPYRSGKKISDFLYINRRK